MDHRVIDGFSPFDFPLVLPRVFPPFLFQSLDPWMCSSFPCQNSSSGFCSRLCLVLLFSICFWACLCLSHCLSTSAELSPWLHQGCHVFDLPVWEFLRLSFGAFFESETTSCAFTSSCTGDAVVTIFSRKMRHIVQATVQAGVLRAPLWFLLRLSDFLLSFHVCPQSSDLTTSPIDERITESYAPLVARVDKFLYEASCACASTSFRDITSRFVEPFAKVICHEKSASPPVRTT